MKRQLLTSILVTVMTLMAGIAPAVVFAEQKLVLVVSSESSLAELKPGELRKLFMGLPVSKQGHVIKPLRNMSDERLNQVFLQKVVYMSEGRYEHHLIARVFRIGGVRPAQFESSQSLTQALAEDPMRVSYMWEDDVPDDSNLKILHSW